MIEKWSETLEENISRQIIHTLFFSVRKKLMVPLTHRMYVRASRNHHIFSGILAVDKEEEAGV